MKSERLTIVAEISSKSDFIKFDVVSNEIPMLHFIGNIENSEYLAMTPMERGKDLIINWEFLDGFKTDNNLWVDFNGLDMQHKRLWERQEFV